jgi:hypothetical protein
MSETPADAPPKDVDMTEGDAVSGEQKWNDDSNF